MTELKTLKDLEQTDTYTSLGDVGSWTRVDSIVLRAEAIIWIKAFENRNWRQNQPENPMFCHTEELITWIMHFFNLTEADLK